MQQAGEPDLSRPLVDALHGCCHCRVFALQQLCQRGLSLKSGTSLHLHQAIVSFGSCIVWSSWHFKCLLCHGIDRSCITCVCC